MLTTCRGVDAGVAVCILIAGLLVPMSALGQFTGAHVPEKISRDESANLFASWAGTAAADGFVIQLPQDWSLEAVTVLKNAFRILPLEVRALNNGRYEVNLENRLEGKGDLVVRVRGGGSYGLDRVTIIPYAFKGTTGRRQMLEPDRLSLSVHMDRSYADPENRVLSFAGEGVHPLILRSNAVPPLDLDRAFSASFWMKSTGLNEVIFSTWNGDENQAYPLELIVGPDGRLRCFRGRPGRHQSIGSRRPIADGTWHHVVVTNEPAAGWMRLQVDGTTVDSLYSATPPPISMDLRPVVGGRVPGSTPYFDGMKPFSGFIDAIHIEVRSGREEVAPFKLDFDRRLPDDLLAEPARGVRLVRSDLSHRRPVDEFSATHARGEVILRWRARGSQSIEYVIERSKDGHLFEVVHRMRASNQYGEYEFRDVGAGEGVAFYRLRQIFTGGAERVSSILKIGMGEDQPESVTLVGNFPNPFNSTTTIGYVVKEEDHVAMSVWDVSGQSVGQLVDRIQGPGYYEVQFDAGDLPSGTYFVRLRSESGTKSHKMILMK